MDIASAELDAFGVARGKCRCGRCEGFKRSFESEGLSWECSICSCPSRNHKRIGFTKKSIFRKDWAPTKRKETKRNPQTEFLPQVNQLNAQAQGNKGLKQHKVLWINSNKKQSKPSKTEKRVKQKKQILAIEKLTQRAQLLYSKEDFVGSQEAMDNAIKIVEQSNEPLLPNSLTNTQLLALLMSERGFQHRFGKCFMNQSKWAQSQVAVADSVCKYIKLYFMQQRCYLRCCNLFPNYVGNHLLKIMLDFILGHQTNKPPNPSHYQQIDNLENQSIVSPALQTKRLNKIIEKHKDFNKIWTYCMSQSTQKCWIDVIKATAVVLSQTPLNMVALSLQCFAYLQNGDLNLATKVLFELETAICMFYGLMNYFNPENELPKTQYILIPSTIQNVVTQYVSTFQCEEMKGYEMKQLNEWCCNLQFLQVNVLKHYGNSELAIAIGKEMPQQCCTFHQYRKPLLESIQSIAQHKLEGNDCYQKSRYASAIVSYTKAMQLIDASNLHFRALMFCNRAAALMQTKQYKRAIMDCKRALTCVPNHIKARLRRSRAHFAMATSVVVEETSFETIARHHYRKAIEDINCVIAQLSGDHMFIAEFENLCKYKHPNIEQLLSEEKKVRAAWKRFNNTMIQKKQEANKKDDAKTTKVPNASTIPQRPRSSSFSNTNFHDKRPKTNSSAKRQSYASSRQYRRASTPFRQTKVPPRNTSESKRQRPKTTGFGNRKKPYRQWSKPDSPLSQKQFKSFVDHYKTLGITRNSTFKEIKKAFHGMALKHHPDKNTNEKTEDHGEKFKSCVEAYQVLSQTSSRKQYDSMFDVMF